MSETSPPAAVHHNNGTAAAAETPSRALRSDPQGGKTPRRRGADPYDAILWRVAPKVTPTELGFALGVTSCDRRAGVSTTAANLAIRAADRRLTPVLLIDANLDHPRQEINFRLHDAPGLTELLAKECELQNAVHPSRIDGLSIMPLGSPSLVDRTNADFETFSALMQELRSEYAVIVCDLPCVADFRQSLLLAQQLDSAVVVLKSESTRRRDAETAIRRLASDGIEVAGAVIAQKRNYVPRWFQH